MIDNRTDDTTAAGTAPALEVGDVVHVGQGHTLWKVESLWDNGLLASLKPVAGYSGTTVQVDRLTLVEKAGDRP